MDVVAFQEHLDSVLAVVTMPSRKEMLSHNRSIIQKRFYATHRERLRAKSRANQDYNRRHHFFWSLKNVYTITFEDYSRMVVEQAGRCKICEDNPKSLHIDHDHATGKVRGLLCGNCNRAIGLAKDNPETLRAMADYVEVT